MTRMDALMQIIGAVHHSNKSLPINKRKRLGMEKGDYISTITKQAKAVWNNMSSYDKKSAEVVSEKHLAFSTSRAPKTKKQTHLVYHIPGNLPYQDRSPSKSTKKSKKNKTIDDDVHLENDLTQEPDPNRGLMLSDN